MDALFSQQGKERALARAGSCVARFWLALREQDLLAIEGFMEDPQWALGLIDTASGRSPAEWCVFLHRHDSLAALLVHGADPNMESAAGSLLAQATRSHCLECMNLLIQAGALVNAEDARGMTPLVEASNLKQESHVLKCVNALLAAGVDTDALTSQGYFALGAAACHNHAAAVEKMLDARANIELNAGDGFTALFYAVDNQASDTVQVLLRSGANYLSRAKAETGSGSVEDVTPFELSSSMGDTQTAAMLYAFAESVVLNDKLSAKFSQYARPSVRRPVRI